MKNILIPLLFIGLSGCSSNDLEVGGLTISYPETQCSDPWLKPGSTSATGWPTDQLRAQAIIMFLQDNKVSSARNVRFIEITPIYSGNNGSNFAGVGSAICQACTCSSGRRIDLTINEIDLDQAIKLGFKKQ